MRKAASGWEDDYSRKLTRDGFRRGRAAPKIIFRPETEMRVVVHGDDFTFAGTDSDLRKIRSHTGEWCDVEVHGIFGSVGQDVQEIETSGRTLRWTEHGLEYEAETSINRRCCEA